MQTLKGYFRDTNSSQVGGIGKCRSAIEPGLERTAILTLDPDPYSGFSQHRKLLVPLQALYNKGCGCELLSYAHPL